MTARAWQSARRCSPAWTRRGEPAGGLLLVGGEAGIGKTALVRASEPGAHREAAQQYVRALAHARTAPPAVRAELLEAHAAEAQACGDYEAARAALREAIVLLQ